MSEKNILVAGYVVATVIPFGCVIAVNIVKN